MIANAIQAQFGKARNWPLGAALSVTTMVIVDADGRRHGADHPRRCRGWPDDGVRSASCRGWLPAYAFLYIAFLYLPVLLPADLLGQHRGDAAISALRLHLAMVRATCRGRRRCSTPPRTA